MISGEGGKIRPTLKQSSHHTTTKNTQEPLIIDICKAISVENNLHVHDTPEQESTVKIEKNVDSKVIEPAPGGEKITVSVDVHVSESEIELKKYESAQEKIVENISEFEKNVFRQIYDKPVPGVAGVGDGQPPPAARARAGKSSGSAAGECGDSAAAMSCLFHFFTNLHEHKYISKVVFVIFVLISLVYQYSQILYWPSIIFGTLFMFSDNIAYFLWAVYFFKAEFKFDFSFSFSLADFLAYFMRLFAKLKEKYKKLTCKQVRFPHQIGRAHV